MKRTALLVGASGLVGGFCLKELLESPAYSRVTVLARSALSVKHPKLTVKLIDFDHLKDALKGIRADDVFCALGTTRKQTPDPETYRKIDTTYPIQLAHYARKNKARQFLVVSSMGADPHSSVAYSRQKGEMEKGVSQEAFEAVHLFRPSFITGERDRKERRPSERLMEGIFSPLGFLFVGSLKAYRPIAASTIAKAMVRTAQAGLKGVHVWPSDQIAKRGVF
jgi:uncharacterized protein YbjT (DUF2867 family)